jgi:hypothetical protein
MVKKKRTKGIDITKEIFAENKEEMNNNNMLDNYNNNRHFNHNSGKFSSNNVGGRNNGGHNNGNRNNGYQNNGGHNNGYHNDGRNNGGHNNGYHNDGRNNGGHNNGYHNDGRNNGGRDNGFRDNNRENYRDGGGGGWRNDKIKPREEKPYYDRGLYYKEIYIRDYLHTHVKENLENEMKELDELGENKRKVIFHFKEEDIIDNCFKRSDEDIYQYLSKMKKTQNGRSFNPISSSLYKILNHENEETKEKSTFDGLFVKNVLLKQSNFSNYVWILTVSLN